MREHRIKSVKDALETPNRTKTLNAIAECARELVALMSINGFDEIRLPTGKAPNEGLVLKINESGSLITIEDQSVKE